ncbi:dynamin family protein [Salinibacter ruber]|uniref:dynamin family protein n=1 Tax=Salinibacter ruber TaxID=146919 RepID=UPI0015E0AAEF|nr:dynamin family protein [Salinibacter ruber]
MAASSPSQIDTEELISYLDEAPIRLAVFGEFSAGKTTVLNALIGEEILSVAIEPTTAVPTRVCYGREFNIFIDRVDAERLVLFEDDPPFWTRFVGRRDTLSTLKKQQDTIREFLRTWTKEGEQAGEVERVIIELPLDWLKGGLELVDTPGVNNEFVRHQGFTEQEAGAADIAVLLMDARQGGGKRTEFEFMNDVQAQTERCVVAPNKMDLIPEDEREEFLQYIRETALPKHWDGAVTPPVHGISALAALHPEEHDEPDLADAFADLRGRLERVAEEERGKLLLARKGNPEKQLFGRAKELEGEEHYGRAHRLYFDLLDILQAAGLDPTPAEEGIARCEEHLSEQVDALDSLNERYNEAMALAEDDPDAALKQLEAIRDEKEDLRLKDGDLHASIEQLQSRIEERDAARSRIRVTKTQVEQHRQNKNWIEAAEAALEISSLIKVAEVSESEEQDLRDLVKSQVDQRNSYIEEQWPDAKRRINSHLSEGDTAQAQEALEPFANMPPSAPHATDIAKTSKRVQSQQEALNAFRESRSEVLTQIGTLREKQVDRPTGVSILQSLRHLAESRGELHWDVDATMDRMEIDFKIDEIDARGHALTVDEKISLVEAAVALLEDENERLHDLKAHLMERKKELRKLNSNASWSREELFGEYPDHPQIGTEDPGELTGLELACGNGDTEAVRDVLAGEGNLLLNIKSNLEQEARSNKGRQAARGSEGDSGSEEQFKYTRWRLVNEADQEGEKHTPLMLATREGHPNIVQMLLEAGADPHVKSQNDFTALHMAAYEGNPKCAKYLVCEVDDPGDTDVNGFTAAEWAHERENPEVLEALIDGGAAPPMKAIRKSESEAQECVHNYDVNRICKKCRWSKENLKRLSKNRKYKKLERERVANFLRYTEYKNDNQYLKRETSSKEDLNYKYSKEEALFCIHKYDTSEVCRNCGWKKEKLKSMNKDNPKIYPKKYICDTCVESKRVKRNAKIPQCKQCGKYMKRVEEHEPLEKLGSYKGGDEKHLGSVAEDAKAGFKTTLWTFLVATVVIFLAQTCTV